MSHKDVYSIPKPTKKLKPLDKKKMVKLAHDVMEIFKKEKEQLEKEKDKDSFFRRFAY